MSNPFKKPKVPKAPKVPERSAAEVQAAAELERRRASSAKGRSSTIVGGLVSSDSATGALKKTILGQA